MRYGERKSFYDGDGNEIVGREIRGPNLHTELSGGWITDDGRVIVALDDEDSGRFRFRDTDEELSDQPPTDE
jgi:hypothetical protein